MNAESLVQVRPEIETLNATILHTIMIHSLQCKIIMYTGAYVNFFDIFLKSL